MKRILAATLLTLAALAITIPTAQARDTTWGCPGCIVTHHR